MYDDPSVLILVHRYNYFWFIPWIENETKRKKEQNMKSKENETDMERKSEDIDDEEIERSCFTKTKILALKDNLTFKYTLPSC